MTITRGGQTTIHSIRMNLAIARFTLRLFLLIFIVSFISIFLTKTNKQTLSLTHSYYKAKFISLYQKDPTYQVSVNHNNLTNLSNNPSKEQTTQLPIKIILTRTDFLTAKDKTTSDLKRSLTYSLIISIVSILLLTTVFITRGKSLSKNKHIRGGKIVSDKVLRKLVKSYNFKKLLTIKIKDRISTLLSIIHKPKSSHLQTSKTLTQYKPFKYRPYNITNNIPYPVNTETQHTIITGGSGTGKTQLIKHLLTQIKQRGDKAIVYDKMGSFIPYFYQEGRSKETSKGTTNRQDRNQTTGDIILNPFDKRSPAWSIFNEFNEDLQLDSIASALMPITKNISDPFWINAARTIFTSVTSRMKERGISSNQELVDNLLKIDLSEIAKIIKGTPAQAIIDERSPKTSLSVMSVLSTYLSSLKYLKDIDSNKNTNNSSQYFSIRSWINQNNQHKKSRTSNGSFLFISSRGDQHESLKPLISTWLEIAINSLLSLKSNHNTNQKTWIILDELPSLHMLPSLNSGIAQSRQFGGCFVLSLQLMSQLRSIYGKDDAETISGLAKTRVVFSSPDEDTARWSSNSLGKIETKELRHSISYGANDIRDGVSLNSQTVNQQLVTATEIMNLNNLECYLKLPFNFPVTKAKVKVHKSKEIAERFVREVNSQVENHDQSSQNKDSILKEETNKINTMTTEFMDKVEESCKNSHNNKQSTNNDNKKTKQENNESENSDDEFIF